MDTLISLLNLGMIFAPFLVFFWWVQKDAERYHTRQGSLRLEPPYPSEKDISMTQETAHMTLDEQGWSKPPSQHPREATLSTRNAELEAENAKLEEARNFWKTGYLNATADAAKFANDLARAEAQRDEALKALEPFAKAATAYNGVTNNGAVWGDDGITIAHLRTARRVSEGGKTDG